LHTAILVALSKKVQYYSVELFRLFQVRRMSGSRNYGNTHVGQLIAHLSSDGTVFWVVLTGNAEYWDFECG
jgi:hypothetical protein